MKNRVSRSLFCIAVVLPLVAVQCLVPGGVTTAQPGQPQTGQTSAAPKAAEQRPSNEEQLLNDLRNRTMTAINSTMNTFNQRIGVFNTQIGIINEARPLDLQNLDSATVAANISHTLGFVSFLATYVHENDSLARALEDSMEVLKSETPTGDEEKAIGGFVEAYKADHTAWNAYLATLKDLYSEVLDVLLFLQKTDYGIKKGQLVFTTADASATYKKLMKPIDATIKRSQKAIEESKQATHWAQQKIEEINDAINGANTGSMNGAGNSDARSDATAAPKATTTQKKKKK